MTDVKDKTTQKTRDPSDEDDYGFGRSRPLTEQEQTDLARRQAKLIQSGKTRKGKIVLRTPIQLAVFIGALIGIILLFAAVFIFV